MNPRLVFIVRYEKPLESVRKAVDLCHGLDHLPAQARVFIKPNIVFWTRFTPFPKWGVITTSRVVEDLVRLLKERGIEAFFSRIGTRFQSIYSGSLKRQVATARETKGHNSDGRGKREEKAEDRREKREER